MQYSVNLGKLLLTPVLFLMLLWAVYVVVTNSDSTDLQKLKFWVELDPFGSGNRLGLSRAWFLIPFYELGLPFFWAISFLLAMALTILLRCACGRASIMVLAGILILSNLYILQISSHLTRQSLALIFFLIASQKDGKQYFLFMTLAVLFHEVVIGLLALSYFFSYFGYHYRSIIIASIGASAAYYALVALGELLVGKNVFDLTQIDGQTSLNYAFVALAAALFMFMKLEGPAEKIRIIGVTLLIIGMVVGIDFPLFSERIWSCALFLVILSLSVCESVLLGNRFKIWAPVLLVVFNASYAVRFFTT